MVASFCGTANYIKAVISYEKNSQTYGKAKIQEIYRKLRSFYEVYVSILRIYIYIYIYIYISTNEALQLSLAAFNTSHFTSTQYPLCRVILSRIQHLGLLLVYCNNIITI